ncbi:hypothetical protein DFR70_13212 [Nocardia tenerifensis]|uniref:DUF7257 domain-containing protein n=1 Tax=Nocardia tenerifensis TaxID=228006 RepID=A0A318JN44_9NOCA|nr:hypothetical protein [Nocardia tenerifensis]PXX52627.1 hypothetical protein DFR70_13212 [Nocardia tenerifensis]
MTSPDKSVPAGAYVGDPDATNNVGYLQKVTWEGARDSVVSGVLGSFSGITAIGGNWKAITEKSQTATTTAQSRSADASSTVADAQTATTANAATIAALTARQTGEQTSGSTFSDDFERTELGTGYTIYKFGRVADLQIVSGQVQLNQKGDEGTGNVVALSKMALKTDDQSVSAVMGRANQAANTGTTLFIRSAADLTSFVYADIRANAVRLGRGTRTTAMSYTGWVNAPTTVSTGDTVTLQATGSNYQVLVNGVPVAAYNDSAKSSPVGAANRSFGFDSSYYWSGLFGYFSFAIAGLTAADLAPMPVTGFGWALARTSSSNAVQPAGSRAVVAGTFDTARQLSGVTVSSLGAGQIQVPSSGWYRMTVGLNYVAAMTGELRADLWWAPSSSATWQQLRTGPKTNQLRSETVQSGTDGDGNPIYTTNTYGYASSVSATFVVYLPAGALVAPGYGSAVSNSLVGPHTYFDGALINRS